MKGETRMENAVGREIPDEILQRYGKEGYKGAYARDGVRYRKTAPRVKGYVDPKQSKLSARFWICCQTKSLICFLQDLHFRREDME